MLEFTSQTGTERRAFAAPNLILLAGFISQVIVGIALWNHRSDDGMIFGGYSLRYALALLANLGAAIFWLAALLRHKTILPKLEQLKAIVRYGLIALSGIGLVIVWLLPIEGQVKQFASLNVLFWGLLLASTVGGATQSKSRQVYLIIFIVTAALLVPMLTTALTIMPFSPDESHWADYATTPFASENPGLYARTWLMEPQVITPGLGWSVAAYGWLLENTAFNIRVGRLWNFLSYCVAFLGIAVLSYRLYGREAAIASTIFAVLSTAFIPVFDYRPDHQIAAAAVWVVVCAVIARQSVRPRLSRPFHFLCGLLAALAMQFHAIAIVLIAGIGLFYLLECAFFIYRAKRLNTATFLPLLLYITGVGIGGAIFFLFNIAPAGGVAAYISGIAGRTQRLHSFPFFLTWPSLFEAIMIVIGFAFILWRRNKSDKTFFSITFCILLALLVLDTQGYRSPVISLYAVPVGAFFAAGFGHRTGNQAQLTALTVLTVVMAASTVGFIRWSSFWSPAAEPPYLYEVLKENLRQYVHDDDTIVSTHLLIWMLGNRPDFYSVAGEITGTQRWGISPEEVWERVQPTLIIDIPSEMDISEGLRQYMAQHNFQECQSLIVQNKIVNLYRSNCA
ncbi:MAG: hypothetical protein IAE89_07180 [Anaerolineae bacterium]|nr:hypothetical protein [Anaerolineae bacterium]